MGKKRGGGRLTPGKKQTGRLKNDGKKSGNQGSKFLEKGPSTPNKRGVGGSRKLGQGDLHPDKQLFVTQV